MANDSVSMTECYQELGFLFHCETVKDWTTQTKTCHSMVLEYIRRNPSYESHRGPDQFIELATDWVELYADKFWSRGPRMQLQSHAPSYPADKRK